MRLNVSKNSEKAPTVFADASPASDKNSFAEDRFRRFRNVWRGVDQVILRKQRCVASSSAEAEYTVLADCATYFLTLNPNPNPYVKTNLELPSALWPDPSR